MFPSLDGSLGSDSVGGYPGTRLPIFFLGAFDLRPVKTDDSKPEFNIVNIESGHAAVRWVNGNNDSLSVLFFRFENSMYPLNTIANFERVHVEPAFYRVRLKAAR